MGDWSPPPCVSHNPGQIQLILGPMFSGKTTELLRRITRYTFAKRSCFLIKYNKDTRYSEDSMATHDRQLWTARAASTLEELRSQAKKSEVIGIDEGQFFPDLVEFCESMANGGKIVIIAALDGTFQRKPFVHVLELVPLAESVTKLNAVCMTCFKDAPFTRRLGTETEVELIGGCEKYVAVCRSCYHKDTISVAKMEPIPQISPKVQQHVPPVD